MLCNLLQEFLFEISLIKFYMKNGKKTWKLSLSIKQINEQEVKYY